MLDVIMASPTAVSSHQSHGASHITGGIFCGCAQGNVFNNADADEIAQYDMQPHMGKVQVDVIPLLPNLNGHWSIKWLPNWNPFWRPFLDSTLLFAVSSLICLIIWFIYFS